MMVQEKSYIEKVDDTLFLEICTYLSPSEVGKTILLLSKRYSGLIAKNDHFWKRISPHLNHLSIFNSKLTWKQRIMCSSPVLPNPTKFEFTISLLSSETHKVFTQVSFQFKEENDNGYGFRIPLKLEELPSPMATKVDLDLFVVWNSGIDNIQCYHFPDATVCDMTSWSWDLNLAFNSLARAYLSLHVEDHVSYFGLFQQDVDFDGVTVVPPTSPVRRIFFSLLRVVCI